MTAAGSGRGARLRAAVGAAESGFKVRILLKGKQQERGGEEALLWPGRDKLYLDRVFPKAKWSRPRTLVIPTHPNRTRCKGARHSHRWKGQATDLQSGGASPATPATSISVDSACSPPRPRLGPPSAQPAPHTAPRPLPPDRVAQGRPAGALSFSLSVGGASRCLSGAATRRTQPREPSRLPN